MRVPLSWLNEFVDIPSDLCVEVSGCALVPPSKPLQLTANRSLQPAW